ncbi:MAG TPA: bifunctional nuclease family protein, partial [Fimbriimonas sp.]|nr:bifunctional nuclease family protein [Fimbriimonas sp.]
GPENLDEPPAFFPYENARREEPALSELIEVQVEGVYQAESGNVISRFVLVSDGTRKLPIIIGPFEAHAIQMILDNDRPDRPMTHDLFKNILDRLSVGLDRVVIDDFWNTIYYAKLYLKREGEEEEIEIDARPSDAIALAVRFDVPIYVADAILEGAIED